MKIAIAKDHNNVSGHFGHCEGFQVYDIEGQSVVGSTFLANPGHQPGVLPKFLSDHDVNVIIAGGMGAKAQQLFQANNIEVVVGVSGLVETTIMHYLEGGVTSTNSVCHNHEHAGDCGEH